MSVESSAKSDKLKVVRIPLLLIFLSLPTQAETRSLFDKVVRTAPMREVALRFELAKGTAIPTEKSGKILPNRVYVAYNVPLQSWTFVLADTKGKLPQHAIAAGTVLAGTRLGGEPGLRYKLDSKKRWIASDDTETLKVWETASRRPEPKTYLIPLDPTHAIARRKR